MPSSKSVSRRGHLAACGSVLAAALAGCVGQSGTGSTVEYNESDTDEIDSTHEYETRFVRSAEDAYFVYPSEDDAPEADDRRHMYRYSTQFVRDEDAAAALHVDADEDVQREIRTFVEETTFDSQSVVIDQRTVEDCYERRVRGVQAKDDSFRVQYCQELKTPETSCEADRSVMEAILIRIDHPYDERPSSRSSSDSRSCGRSVTADRVESGSATTSEASEPAATATDTAPADETATADAPSGGDGA